MYCLQCKLGCQNHVEVALFVLKESLVIDQYCMSVAGSL